MSVTKDKITCHVLDTTAGRPAKGIRVRLEGGAAGLGSPSLKTFESLTDDDGRVRAWLPYSSDHASGEVPVYTLDDVLAEAEATAAPGDSAAKKRPTRWTLRFDTGAYFGEGNTFFPEVTVVFGVLPGQHYHVPLLLSPYSYTTYRGS